MYCFSRKNCLRVILTSIYERKQVNLKLKIFIVSEKIREWLVKDVQCNDRIKTEDLSLKTVSHGEIRVCFTNSYCHAKPLPGQLHR